MALGRLAKPQIPFLLIAQMSCIAIGLSLANLARADGPLGPNGSPIATSDYSIDLTRMPFFGSTRITGMGGASTAIAEGVEGGLQNPAAVASRAPQWPDKLDYWLAFGTTYPLTSGDYFNSGQNIGDSGQAGDDSFLFFLPGADFEIGYFGFGVSIDATLIKIEDVTLGSSIDPTDLRLTIFTTHFQVGYGFMKGQITVGGGLRVLSERFLLGGSSLVSRKDKFYRGLGFGGEAGILVRPHDKRWRLGAALQPGITTNTKTFSPTTTTVDGDIVAGTAFLPNETEVPWQGSVGFSWQFGPRPTNARWIGSAEEAGPDLAEIDRRERDLNEEKEAAIAKEKTLGGPDLDKRIAAINKSFEAAEERLDAMRTHALKNAWRRLRHRFRDEWPRRFVLLSADLLFTGKTNDAVGLESMLVGEVQRAGQKITYTPHAGMETEIWPQHMKLRGGMYYEPSRFEDTNGRVHGTLGLDIRVLSWDVFKLWPEDYIWQVGTAFDIARDYQVMSLTIGGWY